MAIKQSGVSGVKKFRDNASMGRVVFLRPQATSVSLSGWSWREHGRSLGLLLFAMLVITALAFRASGSSFDYYPETCVGSWKNSENAQGKPTLESASYIPKLFNTTNCYTATETSFYELMHIRKPRSSINKHDL